MGESSRRQLPPQIKRVELASRSGGRPVVRYQLTVDVGVVDGKRKQLRKRYPTEKAAREALDQIRGDVARGTYVHPTKTTVAQACDDWLASKHRLKPSTLHGHRVSLGPVFAVLGDIEVQKLTKRHVDDLVIALRAGGLKSPTGKDRKPWTPRSVNYMLGLLTAVLEDQMKQGQVVRNVAALVDRIPSDPKPPKTLEPHEVERVLVHIRDDRYGIAWHLALAGLRRGEIAGLRWEDIDLDAGTLTVARNRLRFGDQVIEGTPKSRSGGRTLPLPEHLAAALRGARAIQAADRLALGAAYDPSGYVIVDEAGQPLSPHALTSRWSRMLKAAGVRPVRLHDARHTCGTLMHLQNVPIALIAAWLGHASSAFTMATYVHSQPAAMAEAAQSFGRIVNVRP
ncbi:site-specific integrase [Mycolicibacterium litorale]|uniref:site-specific integrase n=1 Tax=Mycolicibacterium litorale TaxID=758802 RepID=UPI003CF5CCF9